MVVSSPRLPYTAIPGPSAGLLLRPSRHRRLNTPLRQRCESMEIQRHCCVDMHIYDPLRWPGSSQRPSLVSRPHNMPRTECRTR